MKNVKYFVVLLFFVQLTISLAQENIVIIGQKSGQLRTNYYLIYGEVSKVGTIIDVAADVDTLIKIIDEQNITLKYILITHCHPDHIKGIPALRQKFPEAKLCFSKQEYDDLQKYEEWEGSFAKELVDAWSAVPVVAKLMDYDYGLIGTLDLYIEDSDALNVGNFKINVLATPGHTHGSLTFVVNNDIFSGVLIFYRSDGNMNCTLTSWDDI